MRLLKYRRLILILISLALIFAFGVMTSVAQEKIKLKDRRYWFSTKPEVMKIDATEGHIIQTMEQKGVDVGTGDVSFNKSFSDLVKGNGTTQAYTTTRGQMAVMQGFLRSKESLPLLFLPKVIPLSQRKGLALL